MTQVKDSSQLPAATTAENASYPRIRSVPDMNFPIHIADPKERVEAYMDSFSEKGDNHSKPGSFSDSLSPSFRFRHAHLI
jgi:hypothetical protein